MGAPVGNKFWEVRSKHGRDKLFSTPELMWEAACEYFEWCEDNPIIDPRSFGQAKVQRPFTMQGLCAYLGCNTAHFRQFKDTSEKDFSTIISKIEETVFRQKFENAVIGVFKENIIARDLGLVDKVDAKNTNVNHNSTEMSPQEVKKYNEQLESEV